MMDPTEVLQLLCHEAVKAVTPEEVNRHRLLHGETCLKQRKTKRGVGFALTLETEIGEARVRHHFEALTSTIFYHRAQCPLLNTEILTLVGKVIDLIIVQAAGEVVRVPVLVCPLQQDHFPLAVVTYIPKPLMQPVFTSCQKV